ncbi:MAG: Trm112 family protein [Candidatus Aenigmarchaeota archaeon]|nr:Trm112 family protein [Candidatus Aenigmarchaeota archaeon]
MVLSKELLDVLACPKCKGDLVYGQKEEKLTCGKCRLRFSVIEGSIPNMLLKDAERF